MSLFLYIRDTEERESFKIFSILLYLSFEIFADIATFAAIISYRSIAPVLKTKCHKCLVYTIKWHV